MRVLGLDVGSRRIGVAVTDELGLAAHGLTTLERRGTVRDVEAVQVLCRQHGVERVVVGMPYEVDLAKQSARLSMATQKQRENVAVSPAGYGLHWPEVDEDLSIDGLIGVKHSSPLSTGDTFANR